MAAGDMFKLAIQPRSSEAIAFVWVEPNVSQTRGEGGRTEGPSAQAQPEPLIHTFLDLCWDIMSAASPRQTWVLSKKDGAVGQFIATTTQVSGLQSVLKTSRWARRSG